MKLSDIKGEDAILAAADLLEPIAKIIGNENVKKADRTNKLKFAQAIFRNCPSELIEIFAIIDQKPVDEYEFNLAILPMRIVELLNDPYVLVLFGLQSQTDVTSSGSATESIEVEKK